jgi:hypothetical protein
MIPLNYSRMVNQTFVELAKYPIAQRIPISLPVAHRKQDASSPLARIYMDSGRVSIVFYI